MTGGVDEQAGAERPRPPVGRWVDRLRDLPVDRRDGVPVLVVVELPDDDTE